MNATCGRAEDATAYVLGTMSANERDQFDRHLRYCDSCAEEFELLSQAVFAPEVMVAAPVMPPWEHESHILERTGADSVHIPGLQAPKREQSGGSDRAARTTAAGRGGGRRRLRRHFQPIPKPALTMLLCLLIVAALTVFMSFRARSTIFARGATAWPHSAGIALQLQGNSAELLLTNLPAAPIGEHYEIWALPATATATTTKLQRVNATLTLNEDGQAGVKLPGDIHRDAAVAVYAIPGVGSGASSAKPPSVEDHPVAVVYVPKPGAVGTPVRR